MKAILKTTKAPGIEITNIDDPEIGDNDVLVKVGASSICGSDVQLYRWEESKTGENWWDKLLELPVVLGHEFSGQVVEIGKKVTKVAVGDRIVSSPLTPCGSCDLCRGGKQDFCYQGILGLNANGGMAEFMRLPEAAPIFKIPDHVSFEAASLLEPLCVGFHGVEKSDIKLGDTAMVLGPGPIGLMVLLSLKAAGATNLLMAGTGTDGTRLDLALTLGAQHVMDVEKENAFEKAMDLTNGEGFDFVFEASGSAAAFSQALNLAKPWGKVVSTGTYKDNAAFNPSSMVSYNKTIIGSGGHSSTTWRRAVALITEGIISLEALVSKTFPLDEASTAFELAAQRDVAKIVLTP